MPPKKQSIQRITRSNSAHIKVAKTTVPRGRGEFGREAPPDPITARPKDRVGQTIKSSKSVAVTNENVRSQLQKDGQF
jgi:hypothetical protein